MTKAVDNRFVQSTFTIITMHCFAVSFMCKVVMWSLFVVLGLNTVAHCNAALSREEACSKAKREFEKCNDQGDACDKNQALRNADEFAKASEASFKAELLLKMKRCVLDLMVNCRDFKQETIFTGTCGQTHFEANRHCVMRSCPDWSLVSYLNGNCVVNSCYSSATRVTRLVNSAATFVLITIIALIGHCYIRNI